MHRGGLSEGIPLSRFNQRDLERGTQVELEHTRDRRIARRIAADHLAEFGGEYYRELARLEKRLERKRPHEMGQFGILAALDVLSQASLLAGQDGAEQSAPDIIDYTDATPWERLRIGSELGMYHGMDPPMRRMAVYICDDLHDFLRDGGKTIAGWIRRKTTYAQEAPGVELLQGPYDSLRYRTVDCDDASILFLSLARSIGLPAYMIGVGSLEDPETLLHAVGYQAGPGGLGAPGGTFFELIDDTRYGGVKNGLIFRIPPGYVGITYTPEPDIEGYWAQASNQDRFYRLERA
jgi:hypothetical protein